MIDHKSPKYQFLQRLGITATNQGVLHNSWTGSGPKITSVNPSTGETIAEVITASSSEADAAVAAAVKAWDQWADMPAPKRGDIVRQIGDALRANLDDLGSLVSLEMGSTEWPTAAYALTDRL